jgi:hypothetical protein
MMRVDAVDTTIYSEVDMCLSHLSEIADKRHKLVHRSVNYIEGQLHITNAPTAKRLTSIEADMFDKKELSDMKLDCFAIYLRLLRAVDPSEANSDTPELIKFLQQPWRYKSAKPKTQSPQSREVRKAQKRQRSSSQA